MMPRVILQRYHSRLFLPHLLVSCAILSSLPAVPVCLAATQQDHVAEYKDKYDHENDPVRKAKALATLGDAQVLEFVHQAAANNFDAAFATLTEYRNEVRATFDSLKATGNDAEKKPDGYKQLQIHLRKSLWEMERMMPHISADRHESYEDIRNELGRIQTELIHMLFPREPGGRKNND